MSDRHAGDDLTRETSPGAPALVEPPSVAPPVPEVRFIRLTRKAWAGYSGSFGGVRFKDGRSLVPVNKRQADKIAANTSVVYENEDGSPAEAAGIQTRLVGGATRPAPILAPLAHQTDAQKADEVVAQTAPEVTLSAYTATELEAIAAEKGIAGLREIADPLRVKGRSITDVIEAILVEQAARAGLAALAGGR